MHQKQLDISAVPIYFYNLIWGSKGFDRGFAAGEAIRCDPIIANLNINADENQYAFAA